MDFTQNLLRTTTVNIILGSSSSFWHIVTRDLLMIQRIKTQNPKLIHPMPFMPTLRILELHEGRKFNTGAVHSMYFIGDSEKGIILSYMAINVIESNYMPKILNPMNPLHNIMIWGVITNVFYK